MRSDWYEAEAETVVPWSAPPVRRCKPIRGAPDASPRPALPLQYASTNTNNTSTDTNTNTNTVPSLGQDMGMGDLALQVFPRPGLTERATHSVKVVN